MRKANITLIEIITSIVIIILFFLPWFGFDAFFSEFSISPARLGPAVSNYSVGDSIPLYFLYMIPIFAILSLNYNLRNDYKQGHQFFIISCIVNLIIIFILVISAQNSLNNIYYLDIFSFVDLTQFAKFPFWATIVISIIGLFLKDSTIVTVKEKVQQVRALPLQNNYYEIRKNPKLCCLGGEMAGATMPIGSTGISIGRDANECNFVIRNASKYISRKHLKVTYEHSNDLFFITDYSSNGTFLIDGSKIPTNQRYPVKPGTQFYVGRKEVIFKVVN